MAYTFPTLSISPVYNLEEEREDGTLRSNSENGLVLTNNRVNRTSRKTWKVVYEYAPLADKLLLETFITNTYCGAYTFTWTNVQSLSPAIVRFSELPKFSYIINGYWNFEFSIKEV